MDTQTSQSNSYFPDVQGHMPWLVVAVLMVALAFLFGTVPVNDAAQVTQRWLFFGLLLLGIGAATLGLWQRLTAVYRLELRHQTQLCFVSRIKATCYPLKNCRKIVRHKQVNSSWTTSSKGKQTSRLLWFEIETEQGALIERLTLLSHHDPELEAFIATLEQQAEIDTVGFWHWGKGQH